MRSLVLILAASASLCGCAALQKDGAPPVCDGKHRRPANLYGSVLDPAAPPASAPVAAPAQPDKLSAAPTLLGSCAA
jgi:type IV secretion system protein VirB7